MMRLKLEQQQEIEEKNEKQAKDELKQPPSHYIRAEISPAPPKIRGHRPVIIEEEEEQEEQKALLTYKTEKHLSKRHDGEEGEEEPNYVKYVVGAIAVGAVVYAGVRFLMRNKKR